MRAHGATNEERSRIARLLEAVRIGDLKALSQLRAELAQQSQPSLIQVVVDCGGVEALVRCLTIGTSVPIKVEAAWALANIACGASNHAAALVSGDAVEALVEVLLSPAVGGSPELCDQCLWVLCNLAGEGVLLRDQLIAAGLVGVLGQLYIRMPKLAAWNADARLQVLRTFTWLMSSLCRGKPAPPLEDVQCAFGYFAQVVTGTDDAQMLGDALWGLCYLLEGSGEGSEDMPAARGRRMLSAGFDVGKQPNMGEPHPVLLRIVSCARPPVAAPGNAAFVPAVRLIGQIVSTSGAPDLTDVALASGAHCEMLAVLEAKQLPSQVRRDAAWALQNIAAGTPFQAMKLLEGHGGRAWALLRTASEEDSSEVAHECAWALANLAKGGTAVLSKIGAPQALQSASMALRRFGGLDSTEEVLQRALLDACEASLGLLGRGAMRVAKEVKLLEVLASLQLARPDAVARKAAYLHRTLMQAAQQEQQGLDSIAPHPPSRPLERKAGHLLWQGKTISGLPTCVEGSRYSRFGA